MTDWDNITFKNESNMANAKEELQNLLDKLKQRKLTILCADITYEADYSEPNTLIHLPLHYTEAELEQFFNKLNFRYNNGYGTQHLYGTVWLTYGAWLERWEYDGSEGWELRVEPSIPSYLLK